MNTARVNRIHFWRAIGMSGVARDDQHLPIFGMGAVADGIDGQNANRACRKNGAAKAPRDTAEKSLTPV